MLDETWAKELRTGQTKVEKLFHEIEMQGLIRANVPVITKSALPRLAAAAKS
jgi:hypothetical protein